MHIFLNVIELLLGGWLGLWYGIDHLGTLDWRVTLRGFGGLFGGFALFIHGGVSAALALGL